MPIMSFVALIHRMISRIFQIVKTRVASPFFLVAVMLFFTGLIFCGCGGGGGDSVSTVLSGGGTISGTVISSGSIALSFLNSTSVSSRISAAAEAVANAEAWIEEKPELTAKADSSGRFLISGIPLGAIYHVICRYVATTTGQTFLFRSAAISLTTDNSQKDIGVAGIEPARNNISGILRDSFGNPISTANLSLWGIFFKTSLDGNFSSPLLPETATSAEIKIAAPGFRSTTISIPFFATDLPPYYEIPLLQDNVVNIPPIISILYAPKGVLPNTEIELRAMVTDPDEVIPGKLAPVWETTGGTFLPSADPLIARWLTPSELGFATITARVADSQGASSSVHIGFAVGNLFVVVPRVATFTPNFGQAGKVVTISGSGFGTTQAGNSGVFFNDLAAPVVFWSDTSIQVSIPVEAESGPLRLSVGGVQRTVGNFTVIDYPLTLAPLLGPPGTKIVITGYGFSEAQGSSSVEINKVPMLVQLWSKTSIVAKIPTTANTGSITVNIRDRDHFAGRFEVSEINGVTPTRGIKGTEIVIDGAGFGAEQGESKIAFTQTKEPEIISWENEKITVKVPPKSVTGPIALTISGVTIQTDPFTVKFADLYKFEKSWSGPRLDSSPKTPGIAIDKSDNVYLTDHDNHWVWKFDSSGNFVKRFGTEGDGNGQFTGPWGIATDREGNILVSDMGNNRIQKFDSEGNFISAFGRQGTENGEFGGPSGIAVDSGGNIYVTDSINNRVQKFASNGSYMSQFGEAGNGDGQFDYPNGVAISNSGEIFVADTNNHRIQKFDAGGVFISWLGLDDQGNSGWHDAGSARTPVSGENPGQFSTPYNIGIDDSGNLFILDSGNSRIQVYAVASTSPEIIGAAGAVPGQFNSPTSIAVSASDIFVADYGNSRGQQIGRDGSFKTSFIPDTSGLSTLPTRLVAESVKGMVYVLDTEDGTVNKYSNSGDFVKKIGSPGSGDGQLKLPRGIAADVEGNIYVADTGNARIQKFDSEGVFLLKFGAYGTGDGQFRDPQRVAIASNGMILVADFDNNRIQKFDAQGTFIGKWGTVGNGNGQFENPNGIAVDLDGNVYVADMMNFRIQKFMLDGQFLGWWGADTNGFAGWHGTDTASIGKAEGGTGRFSLPVDVFVDSDNCVYVVDANNNNIQKFAPDQSLGDTGNFLMAMESADGYLGVSLDTDGNLYLTEGNKEISKYNPGYK